MLFTQRLALAQLTLGSGVGTGRVVVPEDGLLVTDEGLVVENLVLGDGDFVEIDGVGVVVVGRFEVLVEGNFVVVVERGFVEVDRGIEGDGNDPPVIRFLIPRSNRLLAVGVERVRHTIQLRAHYSP